MKLKEIERKGLEKFYQSYRGNQVNPSLRNKLKIIGYTCLSILALSPFYGYDIMANNKVLELQRLEEDARKSLLEKGYSLEQIEGKRK